MLSFPFGMPITPVHQTDTTPKTVFVLGVYASAVHARWVDADGRTLINALAVASEPEIFWRGDNVSEIVERIPVPAGAGRLIAANRMLNGPSGIALDAWLCDLLPESRCNPKQRAALAREYDTRQEEHGLPAYNFPPVPSTLASDARRSEITREIGAASSEILITLGDQPLKWFAAHYGAHAALGMYGDTSQTYGRLHHIEIGGRAIKLLPLVHPRQAGRLGSHSAKWSELHAHWVSNTASSLLAPA